MDKYLFGNINKGYKSGRWSNNDVNRKFRWLSNKLGKRIHPHLLRTSFSCNRQIEGMPLPAVSAILGHSNARVTERYTGVMNYTETKEVYEKFSMRFNIDAKVKIGSDGIDKDASRDKIILSDSIFEFPKKIVFSKESKEKV